MTASEDSSFGDFGRPMPPIQREDRARFIFGFALADRYEHAAFRSFQIIYV